MRDKERHNEEQEEYGYMTRKFTVLLVKKADIKDIVKLYQRKTAEENNELFFNWEKLIKNTNKDNFGSPVFVIRDKSKKIIGILEADSDDAKSFEIGIWIPNKAKQVMYLDDIKDSFIEWIELGETPIERIISMKVLHKMEKDPRMTKYDIIQEEIIFEEVS